MSDFDYHLSTVLRTKRIEWQMTPEKQMRAAWSNAKQVLPSKLLKIQHRIIILN